MNVHDGGKWKCMGGHVQCVPLDHVPAHAVGACRQAVSQQRAATPIQGTRLYELLGWGTRRGVALGRPWLGEEPVDIAFSPRFSPSTLASRRREREREYRRRRRGGRRRVTVLPGNNIGACPPLSPRCGADGTAPTRSSRGGPDPPTTAPDLPLRRVTVRDGEVSDGARQGRWQWRDGQRRGKEREREAVTADK
uniref:Uncharacterized protein n=1 Tax=Oryza rufipogon TaxID=4529 RepID=A0A0E0N5S0_ORYRU